MKLNDDIRLVKGIGDKKALLLNKLNLYDINDVLHFYPKKYEDRRHPIKIIEADIGKEVLLNVKVVNVKSNYIPKSKKTIIRVLTEDNTGLIELLFFNAQYLKKYFHIGEDISVYGKINLSLNKKEMINPEFHKLNDKDDLRGLIPIYPLTNGITQKTIRDLVFKASECIPQINEYLPKDIVLEANICDPQYAINNIHFPKEANNYLEAKYRLVFTELLTLQTGLLLIKSNNSRINKGIKFDNVSIDDFLSKVPFDLTEGQIKAINDIRNDLSSDISMNRLVQGDVGSGKTMVSMASMYMASRSGYQSVLMAPTEILAKQHYQNIKAFFEPFSINVGLLIGSQTKKEKEAVLNSLLNNEIDILIGTHAIIEPGVKFNNLGLVITDEQHRFGVNQRTILTEKGSNPNVLVMTATPIPRTLAVILYGDLDISIIDTLPKGRMPIKTYSRNEDSRDRIYDFIVDEVSKGRQAYIVCPLVTESENIDCKSAKVVYDELVNKYPNIRFGLMYGELKAYEKDLIFSKFLNKEIDVLVSTVVIEVGVDVSNASVIVIENSERFGLSQLHQLRGRVGRSSNQSYCILISNSENEISKKRNEIMCTSNDGFFIAEEDLKLRGPGDIFGVRQHGIPELQIADLVKNISILEKVKNISNRILLEDPSLSTNKYKGLKERIINMFGENISLKL